MECMVSVIVPVYNAEKYLETCIRSLLAQTLKELEIILVDDGSTDKSGEICDYFAQNAPNVFVFHLENGGPSRARNYGISKARGQYIGFVDADDYIVPEMFAELLASALQDHAEMVMCSYSIDNGSALSAFPMEYQECYRGYEEIKEGLLARYYSRFHNGLYSVCNKLFDRGMLQKNAVRFNESLIRAEDAWFVFDCLKHVNTLRYIQKPLYVYRQVASSTMHTIQQDRYERSKNFRKKLLAEAKCLEFNLSKMGFITSIYMKRLCIAEPCAFRGVTMRY